MKTKISTLLGAGLALLATFGITHTAAAQAKGKGFSLPPSAHEIEPGVYYLGRAKDRAGRDVDGIAFVHYRQFAAKSAKAGGGGHTKSDPCYAFLYSGVHWQTPKDYVVSPTIADAPDGALFLDQIGYALANWELGAGRQIFGNGTVGEVDPSLVGNININGVNEVTFAPIADPSTLAYAFVWGVFNGSPSKRELTEWDVVLRDDVPWSATGEPGKYDFWDTFAHESGHAAGMAHPSDTCTEETMYRFTPSGETKKRTLNDGDLAGIAALYK